ncbi:MAG: hypothetical protein KDB53_16155, partial [Planctomycetes bacterium]|nr:hypothetical protein [Planctomycetota bacterium]
MRLTAIALVVGLMEAVSLAQQDPAFRRNRLELRCSEDGETLQSLLAALSALDEGSWVLSEPGLGQRIIRWTGTARPRRSELGLWLRCILVGHGLTTEDLGEGIQQVKTLESTVEAALRAPVLSAEDLAAASHQFPDRVLTTRLTLRHLAPQSAVLALRRLLPPRSSGTLMALDSPPAILISQVGATIDLVRQVLEVIDLPETRSALPKLATLRLHHHDAAQLAPLLDALFAGEPNPTPPRVLADGQTNSLVFRAGSEQLEALVGLAASLDLLAPDQGRDFLVIRPRFREAESLRRRLLGRADPGEGSDGDSGRASIASAKRERSERRFELVADPESNTLVAMGHAADLRELEELVRELDRPAPTVEVEVLVVDLDDGTAREIGVELAGIGDLGFGATSFGLSSLAATLGIDGSIVGLDRRPNLDFQGLASGWLTSATGLPILVRALEREDRARLVSEFLCLADESTSATMRTAVQVPLLRQTESVTPRDLIDANPGSTPGDRSEIRRTTEFDDFEDAEMRLTVTPMLARNGVIRLELELVLQTFRGPVLDPALPPSRNDQRLESTLSLSETAGAWIGGIR